MPSLQSGLSPYAGTPEKGSASIYDTIARNASLPDSEPELGLGYPGGVLGGVHKMDATPLTTSEHFSHTCCLANS